MQFIETFTSKIINRIAEKSGCDSKLFHGVLIDNLSIVEDLTKKSIFIYNNDIEDEYFMEDLARRSISK